jgi:GR25 family glycosyltransferase involved in LPS biosynthesis
MGFKFKSETLFRDLETGEKLQTQPWVIREEYQKSFLQYVEKMRFALEDSQADYELIDTAKPFDVALMAYLHKRGKLS